jgi:hypothetical protein
MLDQSLDLSILLSRIISTWPDSHSAVYNGYLRYKRGELSAEDFLDLFYDNSPFIPLLYRCSFSAYSRSVRIPVTPIISDPFYGFENIS